MEGARRLMSETPDGRDVFDGVFGTAAQAPKEIFNRTGPMTMRDRLDERRELRSAPAATVETQEPVTSNQFLAQFAALSPEERKAAQDALFELDYEAQYG